MVDAPLFPYIEERISGVGFFRKFYEIAKLQRKNFRKHVERTCRWSGRRGPCRPHSFSLGLAKHHEIRKDIFRKPKDPRWEKRDRYNGRQDQKERVVKVKILDAAETDLEGGYRFYERQSASLGSYFLDSLYSDIDSLSYFGGIHRVVFGYH
jgi:hypothetical protein